MSKFKRSWLLFKSSLSIMVKNKQLLVFPIVVFAFTMLIVLFFLAPVVLRPTGYSYVSAQHWQAVSHSLFTQTVDERGRTVQTSLTPGAMVYLAFMYFVSMFFATFFNVAFYHEILACVHPARFEIRLHKMEGGSDVDFIRRLGGFDNPANRTTVEFRWPDHREIHRHGVERRFGLCDSNHRAG